MIFLTSDPHRDFAYIKEFCHLNKTNKDDIIFVTGDAQINYFLDDSDREIKKELNELPITFIFIQGNKEKRPNRISTYKTKNIYNADFYYEEEFPNQLYAKDGEVIILNNKKYLVMGGAYSVYAPGKEDGDFWWKDEQMSEENRLNSLKTLQKHHYEVDYVLSHAAPYSKIPELGWIKDVDKNTLDLNFEKFLDEIDQKIKYKKWFIGHYHINHVDHKYNYVFKELVAID